MDFENKIELKDILSNKQTLTIFLFLKSQNRPLGVREIQRSLNISSVGSTHWHLQKLFENNLLTKVKGNKFQIHENYVNLRQIPVNTVINHYLIGNKMVPNIFFLIFFLIMNLILLAFCFITNLWIFGFFLGFFGNIISLGVVIIFYRNLVQ